MAGLQRRMRVVSCTAMALLVLTVGCMAVGRYV
jgi:hypothetical protein